MTQPACHNEADYLDAMAEMTAKDVHGCLEQLVRNLGEHLGYDRCIEILTRERTRRLCASVAACRGGGS